jgi:hypothetical protein
MEGRYTLRMANQAGWLPLWRAMRSRNACKTCALGMGGQMGGMVNEAGHFPEVCKKSLQAMVAYMRAGISADFFARYSIAELRTLSPRELKSCGRLVDPPLRRAGRDSLPGGELRRGARSCCSEADGKRSWPELLLRERPFVERGRLLAAALRPGVRQQRRQQLFLLLPPGGRRPCASAATCSGAIRTQRSLPGRSRISI